MAAIARLGLAVTATFVVVWAPFLANPSAALHVLHRIMPLKRGLYEDYVANFWCTTSMLVKWRNIFSQQVCRCFMPLALSTHSECAVSYLHSYMTQGHMQFHLLCAGACLAVHGEHSAGGNASAGAGDAEAHSKGPAHMYGQLGLCILSFLVPGDAVLSATSVHLWEGTTSLLAQGQHALALSIAQTPGPNIHEVVCLALVKRQGISAQAETLAMVRRCSNSAIVEMDA